MPKPRLLFFNFLIIFNLSFLNTKLNFIFKETTMKSRIQELRFSVKPKYKPKPNKRWGIIIEHKKEKKNDNT